MEETDLPKPLIKRIAKARLAQLDTEAGRTDGREIQISKDALLALSESARVFINYLTATGNDICKEAKRQIISLDDVLTAIEDLEFGEMIPPLKESLEVFKADSKEKSKKRAEQAKKRKLDDAAAAAVASEVSKDEDPSGEVAGGKDSHPAAAKDNTAKESAPPPADPDVAMTEATPISEAAQISAPSELPVVERGGEQLEQNVS